MDSSELMVWVDVETTGLSPYSNVMLELGLAITDALGNVKGKHSWLIHDEGWTPEYFAQVMEDGVHDMHIKSGLINSLAMSKEFWDPYKVMDDALAWLAAHNLKSGEYPMCGSSIHFDRSFLLEHMRNLHDWFHYRNVDVSTLKNVCRLVNPPVAEAVPSGRKMHRVLPDLDDSIAEYKFYLDNLLFVTV